LESNQTEHEKMNLNSFGEILLFTWNDLINHYKGIKLGDFVIMPNHFHGIIHIVDLDTEWDDFIPSNFKYHDVVAGLEPAPTDHAPLSEIVRQLKTFSARRINRERKTPGISVWQRNYYEHIIRTKESYDQIVEYIQNNPMMWKMDKLFVV
jgi:REP element-mobilizing transposase RayT